MDEMIRLREKNKELSVKEAREKVSDLLKANRAKYNTDEGYGIIDFSEEALNHLDYGKVSLKRVQKILLMSDGLLLPVDHGEKDAWAKSAAIAFEKGLDKLLEEVEKREADDPDCVLYPRLKPKDDKTGILLEL